MILNELKKYYKLKINIMLIVIWTILIIGSYYASYLQKMKWVAVLNSGAKDANLDLVADIIAGYTNMQYFKEFIFSPKFFLGFWIICVIGFGVAIGSSIHDDLNSNYGTMIITRIKYEQYLKNILIARVIYITTLVLAFFLVAFGFTILMGNGEMLVPVDNLIKNHSIVNYLFFVFLLIIHMIIYTSVLILLSTVSNVFIRNRYLIQMLPFIMIVGTYILSSTVANFSTLFANLSYYIVIDSIILGVRNFCFSANQSLRDLFIGISFILVSFSVFIVVYIINKKKFSKDYLL